RRMLTCRSSHMPSWCKIGGNRLGIPFDPMLEEAPAFAAWEEIPIDTPRLEGEFDHWLSRGVSAVTSFDRLGALRALRERATRSPLPLRVQHSIPIEELRAHADPTQLRDELELPDGGRLRVEWAKVFLDGTLGSMTAWMNDPYCGTGAPEGDRARGAPQFDENGIDDIVDTVARSGLAIAIHAIGDRAVEVAAEMIVALRRRRGARLDRIEHAECISDRALRLIVDHSIPVSVQPCHLLEDWRTADRRLGEERSRSVLPLRTLQSKGVPIVLGTDAPVETDDPWVNIRAAVDRVGRGGAQSWIPDERIGWSSAFRGLTRDAQRWNALPKGWGTLGVGSPADLQLLDTDQSLDQVSSIEVAQPRLVLVDGEPAWGGFGPLSGATGGRP
ncbi:MAG: amidohydrolase family protein, partial [Planctomycetota bacterium]